MIRVLRGCPLAWEHPFHTLAKNRRREKMDLSVFRLE